MILKIKFKTKESMKAKFKRMERGNFAGCTLIFGDSKWYYNTDGESWFIYGESETYTIEQLKFIYIKNLNPKYLDQFVNIVKADSIIRIKKGFQTTIKGYAGIYSNGFIVGILHNEVLNIHDSNCEYIALTDCEIKYTPLDSSKIDLSSYENRITKLIEFSSIKTMTALNRIKWFYKNFGYTTNISCYIIANILGLAYETLIKLKNEMLKQKI